MSDRFDRYIQGGEPVSPIKPKQTETEVDDRPELPEGHSYLYSAFEVDLSHLLNRHSKENESGTPDHILAEYLIDCLKVYNKAVVRRAAWRQEPIELPALHDLENGVRTVPLVVYSGNLRMRNEIGEAKIKMTPGEQLDPPFGQIEAVIAKFEEMPDEQ